MAKHSLGTDGRELNYKLAVSVPISDTVILNDMNNVFELVIIILLKIFQQCQRFCLFEAVVTNCECLHPLYTDFDELRQQYVKGNETLKLKICDLLQEGKIIVNPNLMLSNSH